jgi:cytochrome c oxidase subunit 2
MQHHSVLHPAGPQASQVYALWHQLAITATVVFVLVVAGLLYAALHRRTAPVPPHTADRRAGRAIGAAVSVTVAILMCFVGASLWADRAVTAPSGVTPLHIRVIGHEWWWELQYDDSVPQHLVVTANEMHVPTGRPVRLELTSSDVIHSFWVPNVSGKMDLVPGRTNWLSFQVDSAGTWRGACAEFCGLQHARMKLTLVAERPDQFARWLAREGSVVAAIPDSLMEPGRQVFEASGCALCHTVRGTQANGLVGPDLTHVGGRQTIAAGALANTPENLTTWIADPSGIKAGTMMPPTRTNTRAMHELVVWLESLR